MKKMLLFFCLAFSIGAFAKTTGEKDRLNLNYEKTKIPIQIWCEVRGVYSKFTGENGVENHVCSMVSQNAVCYYVRCVEWNDVATIQTNVPPGISIEEGTDFIAIPNENGYEIIYSNGYSYQVVNNTLTITPN